MSAPSSLATAEAQTRECDRHGEYISRRSLFADYWTSCPQCSAEESARAHAVEQERDRQERIARVLRGSGIPARFEDAAFDDSLPAALRAWTDVLLTGNGQGPVLLVGGVGTGKTHAACAVLAHVLRSRAIAGRFTTPGDYGRLIRDQWTAHERTEGSIVEQFAKAPVLVLDDVGAQRTIDTELLQDLIGTRYAADRMHATVITSNLAAAKLAEAIGERAADRIRECSTVIPMTGRSRRCPA